MTIELYIKYKWEKEKLLFKTKQGGGIKMSYLKKALVAVISYLGWKEAGVFKKILTVIATIFACGVCFLIIQGINTTFSLDIWGWLNTHVLDAIFAWAKVYWGILLVLFGLAFITTVIYTLKRFWQAAKKELANPQPATSAPRVVARSSGWSIGIFFILLVILPVLIFNTYQTRKISSRIGEKKNNEESFAGALANNPEAFKCSMDCQPAKQMTPTPAPPPTQQQSQTLQLQPPALGIDDGNTSKKETAANGDTGKKPAPEKPAEVKKPAPEKPAERETAREMEARPSPKKSYCGDDHCDDNESCYLCQRDCGRCDFLEKSGSGVNSGPGNDVNSGPDTGVNSGPGNDVNSGPPNLEPPD
ncbi:MAG: hypothetical protein PHC97_03085 [Patescibacteria group bacterium]|nr:hypothetical protein [Patescibacteria group bacterium]